MERGGGGGGCGTKIIPYLSNIVNEREMKEVDWNRGVALSLFVLIQPDMHGWSDYTQSGHI